MMHDDSRHEAHLLPPNASRLERALSLAADPLTHLGSASEALIDFKTDPADALLPWLIWEYGLGELLPYLPEPRRAIAEGIRWQRLRGTPAALTTALSWIGATATVEQETPGIHFAEFQFDPGLVLDTDKAIANLIAIARLSAPARSRLSRIYHGYDRRRLVLDESRLGEALLSDHSGVFWSDGQTKLSFGRVRKFAQPAQAITLIPAREAVRFATARLLDRYLLDFSSLGDVGHTPNEEIIHAHLFTLANALGLADPLGFLPERRFCRAMVVLSDSTPLGDINANLPRFVWQEVGQALSLGEGDPLSATPHRLIRVEVLERNDIPHPTALRVLAATVAPGHTPTRAIRVSVRADRLLGILRLGDPRAARDVLALTRTHDLPPAPLRDPAGWLPARRYCRAMVVLSDSTPLGDINANLPRFIWQEEGKPIRLGSGDWLSATPHRLIRVEMLERTDADHPGSVTVPPLSLRDQRQSEFTHRVSARADMPLGRLRLGDEAPVRDVLSLTRLYSLMQAPLPDPAGWLPRLFQKAQLVLSDNTVLGDVNSRTPRCAVFRRFTISRLGELALGDLAEITWQPLTEMHIGTSVLTAPAPYTLADPAAHQQRLQGCRILPGTPLGALHLGDPGPIAPATSRREASCSQHAAWTGQSWTGVRWPTSSWSDTREVIGTHHLTQ